MKKTGIRKKTVNIVKQKCCCINKMISQSVENSIIWLNNIISRNNLQNICVGNAAVLHLNCHFFCVKQKLEVVAKCDTNLRYHAVMLSIHRQKHDGEHGRHRNAVLVDNELKTFERFEPNGSFSELDEVVDSVMELEFREKFMLEGYTYIPPNHYCPRFGPQKHVKGTNLSGTCIFWSLWYVEQRLLNPEKSQSDIVNELLRRFDELGPDYAVDFIQSYIDKINRQNVYLHGKYSTPNYTQPKAQVKTKRTSKKPSTKAKAKRTSKKPSTKAKAKRTSKKPSTTAKVKRTSKKPSTKAKVKRTSKKPSTKRR